MRLLIGLLAVACLMAALLMMLVMGDAQAVR
jgi:hypothetical protein